MINQGMNDEKTLENIFYDLQRKQLFDETKYGTSIVCLKSTIFANGYT